MTTAPTIAGAAAGLEFDRTVPRELVHKSAIAEVFIADSRQLDETTFACAVHLPLMHAFYNDALHDHHTLSALLEAERQAGILVNERHVGVTPGHASLLHELALEISEPSVIRLSGSPAEALLVLEITDRSESGGAIAGVSLRTTLLIDGQAAGTGTLTASIQPPEAYTALRRSQRARRSMGLLAPSSPAPADPRVCGKRRRSNVVISKPRSLPGGAGLEAAVIVDTSHPSLFDHQYDHVPGMLLLEAASQMAVAAVATVTGADPATLVPVGCRGSFSQYAEIELPITCRARVVEDETPAGARAVELTFEQPDLEVCEVTIDVAAATETEES
jgi:2-oxo-3-(phosphooxy)propyl 3-oxoalkanoate synthase